MFSILVIANDSEQSTNLSSEIFQRGYTCSVSRNDENTLERLMLQAPSLVLIDVDGLSVGSGFSDLCQKIRQEMHIPVIALVPGETLLNFTLTSHIDDFIVKPWEATELTARIKRILRQTDHRGSEERIKCGDLVIDTAKCQISLGDKLVMLTFREYQLLKFLARNQGKVFTREDLLNKVWGWDYYGGDRTVDVHVRRLRSKIEHRNHSFIETVRNIGYRFKENT